MTSYSREVRFTRGWWRELWRGRELEMAGLASFNWIFAELSTMNLKFAEIEVSASRSHDIEEGFVKP